MRNVSNAVHSIPDPSWVPSPDDRVLVRAIALAGDVVTAPELERLFTRWAWARPISLARVHELEALRVLTRAADGWYVKQRADALVGDSLGPEVQSLLLVTVGSIMCELATDLDRFRLGLRRVRSGGDERVLIAHCRRWAASEAGLAGPRGKAFVEAMGMETLPRGLRSRVIAAVPAIDRGRSISDRIAAVVPWRRGRRSESRDVGTVALVLLLAGLTACAISAAAQVDSSGAAERATVAGGAGDAGL